MSLWGRISCGLNFHKWQYLSPSSCLQKCQSCGEERTEHDWGEPEFAAAKSCQLVRRCRRDGIVENDKLQHSWGEWGCWIPGSCRVIRICSRCDEREDSGEERHIWGNEEYRGAELCEVVKRCTRCPDGIESVSFNHTWAYDVYEAPDKCQLFRVCTRCRDAPEPYGEERHVWGPWGRHDNDRCDLTRRCTRCGHRDRHPEDAKEHDWKETYSNPCIKTIECVRCGRSEHFEQHDWDTWQYESDPPISCNMIRTCRRCGLRQTAAEVHRFLKPEQDGRHFAQKCERCDHTVRVLVDRHSENGGAS